MLLDVAPRAHGLLFEPSAQAAACLKDRFGSDERLRIVEAAVGDVPGALELHEEPDAGETTSLVAGHSGSDAITRTVAVVTIDAELGADRLDLLKIDTEGYDLHVLRGARRALAEHRIAVVQFEYNRPWARAGSTLAAAYELLQGLGYEVFALRHDGLHAIPYDHLGDFFSYANFVAVAPGVEGLSITRKP
jgi:FkbM family methyltransferase